MQIKVEDDPAVAKNLSRDCRCGSKNLSQNCQENGPRPGNPVAPKGSGIGSKYLQVIMETRRHCEVRGTRFGKRTDNYHGRISDLPLQHDLGRGNLRGGDAATEDRRGIDVLNHPRADRFGWVDVYAVDRVWAKRIRKGKLADQLPSLGPNQLFLSPRAHAALEGLRLTGSVRILPATIVDARGNKLADYYFFHATAASLTFWTTTDRRSITTTRKPWESVRCVSTSCSLSKYRRRTCSWPSTATGW